ncbi:NAD(P)/FAD-dependent oxidoreductase [Haloferula sp.]|uniref:NAD(P)/FAD-dependent oxidoreductase n=1 Tax=Haloferula sp. TaxID=2497595 RepID=UPI003C75DE7B
MKTYDVAIVGASISGASLAACLGQSGRSVALIDKACFPRRKACGEGLSNVALDALGRMGFKMGAAVDSGLPYYAYRLDLGRRSYEFATGRERRLKGVGVQRMILDQVLLDRASSLPSVVMYGGMAVCGIERDSQGCSVSMSTGDRVVAKQLVLADGANSACGKMLGIPVRRTAEPLWGISFILEGSYSRFAGEVVVILKDGFEINCTPVSPTRLNVTFLTKREHVKRLQDPAVRERLLAEAMRKTFFSGHPLEPPLQVGPVSTARRGYVWNSIMMLGDAAENLDPIAGMGMTHGVLMAEIAAECLISIHRDGVDPQKALVRYAKLAGKMSRSYRGFTRLTASLLRSPARRYLLPVLSSTFLPGMVRSALDDDPGQTSAHPTISKSVLQIAGVQAGA